MIDNPNHLAAALMELAEQNRPSMCSWVSARLRDIADNLVEPTDNDDNWQYPGTYYLDDEGEAVLTKTAGETAERNEK